LGLTTQVLIKSKSVERFLGTEQFVGLLPFGFKVGLVVNLSSILGVNLDLKN
jgi:hypothetical protein